MNHNRKDMGLSDILGEQDTRIATMETRNLELKVCLGEARARIATLESGLRSKDSDLATVGALCMSHEGHIDKLEQQLAAARAECERLRGLIGICDAHKTLNYVLDGGCEACDKEYAIKRAALAAGNG